MLLVFGFDIISTPLICVDTYVYTYCLRGALPPVDLRAVCFVRAILICICL